jgi:5-bromo-4-chloroindolyl phosphate hydrolysis protein
MMSRSNYVLVYLSETDGDMLLETVKEKDLKDRVAYLKKRGMTRWDYAIIKGDVHKGFNQA